MSVNIQNGDCLELLKTVPSNSIDCIITSPPYNKSFFNKQKKSNQIWGGFEIKYNSYLDNLSIEDYEEWMIDFINTGIEKLKDSGSFFFNHKPIRYENQVYFPLNFIMKSKAKVYQEIIWDRHNSPNIRKDILVPSTERIYWLVKDKPKTFRDAIDKEYIGEVWNMSAKPTKLHPAPFPIELPYNCIKLTTEIGDTVMDPFMGIGTTGEAALNLDRGFIGFELDENYFEIANQRLKSAQNKEVDLWN